MLGDLIRHAPLLGYLKDHRLDRAAVLEVRRDTRGLLGAWGGPHLGLGPVLGLRPGASEVPLLADPGRLPLCDAAVSASVWADAGEDCEDGELEAILGELLRVSAGSVAVGLPASRLERVEWQVRADARYELERRAWGGRLTDAVSESIDRLPEAGPERERAERRWADAWVRLARETADSDSGRTLLVLRRRDPVAPVLGGLEGLPGSGPGAVARALSPALRCPSCAASALEPTGESGAPLRCRSCGRSASAGPRGIPDLRARSWRGHGGSGTRGAAAKGAPDASVVIPVYGQLELTRNCVASLLREPAGADFEVVLVDNATPEDLPAALREFLPRVRVLRNEVNVGFARACNQGAAAAAGRHVLFLNNDTEVHPGWLAPLVASLDSDPDVGVVGSRLLFPDGTIQHAGVAVARDPGFPQGVAGAHVYRRDPADAPHVNRSREFQAVTAACCLVRRDLFDALGGFDPAFWNGLEDLDLCFRARAHGFRVMYEPRSVVTHHESMGGRERFSRLDHNAEVLNARWAGWVRPDLHQIHLADGYLPQWRRKDAGPATELLPVGAVSVVIVAAHGAAALDGCLAALDRHTPLPHEVLVAWDATRHGEFPGALSARGATGVPTDLSSGLPQAWNRCLRAARGTAAVLLDDRARVEAGWLEGLLGALTDRDGTGLAGPLLNVPSGPQALGGALACVPPGEVAPRLRRLRGMDYLDARRLRPECLALSARAMERLGELDEGLENGLSVADYCLRAREAGLLLTVAGDTWVRLEPPPSPEESPGAERAFTAKWGVSPAAYFGLGHPALARVPDLPQAGDPALRRVLESALERLESGRVEEALEVLGQAGEAGCWLADVPLLRGMARCAGEDFEAGAVEFEEAVRRAPRSRRALGHLAHVLRHLGRSREAAGVFTRLLQLDPQDPEVLLDTGDCLLAMGRLDTARECFTLARRLAPEDPAVRERLHLLDQPGNLEELPLAG